MELYLSIDPPVNTALLLGDKSRSKQFRLVRVRITEQVVCSVGSIKWEGAFELRRHNYIVESGWSRKNKQLHVRLSLPVGCTSVPLKVLPGGNESVHTDLNGKHGFCGRLFRVNVVLSFIGYLCTNSYSYFMLNLSKTY